MPYAAEPYSAAMRNRVAAAPPDEPENPIMPQTRIQAFEDHIRRAGIPIDGISVVDGSTSPPTLEFQYQPAATQEQRDWAAQAVGLWDWRPRRFLGDATIASVIAGLTTQQQNALMRRLLVLVLKEHEQQVAQALSDLGLSLPYDEVTP